MNLQGLSSSEKRLLAILCVLLAIVVNGGLAKFFVKNRRLIADQEQEKRAQIEAMQVVAQGAPFWRARSEWLQTAQPRFESEASAGNALLTSVKELASKQGLSLSKQQLASVLSEPGVEAIPVQFEVKGGWQGFCRFLMDLQAPDRFIVIQSARLKVDPSDATAMRGDFTIAKWFAPR